MLFLCAALATAFACGGNAGAQEQPGTAPLTIISRGPTPEFRVHGVSLRSVRADDAQNTVAFDFNGPVSEEAFDQLQDELPDWVEMAYAGYDNAVIRAKRPVTFMTKTEDDGFSMRLVPRAEGASAPVAVADATPPVAPQPAVPPSCGGRACPPPFASDAHAWHSIATYYARAANERPFDMMIRGAYDAVRDGGTSAVFLDTDWRHSKAGASYSTDLHANIDTGLGVRLLADFRGVLVNSHRTRQPDGSIVPYNATDYSGALGVGFPLFDGAHGSVEALYGSSGFGARVAIGGGEDDWRYAMRAAYHEPYVDVPEDVAFKAERDYSALFATGQIMDGLWGTGEIRATRYGVKGDENLATSAAFHAGLRYELDGWPFSLAYDADGEYLLHSHSYAGVPPTPFVPLGLRDREVHSFGGSFSGAWDDGFWYDLYGGYAIDRYANRGPFGGIALRFTPAPGWDVLLGGRYSTVADKEGGSPNKVSAGLKLTYAWGGDAPIMQAAPGL